MLPLGGSVPSTFEEIHKITPNLHSQAPLVCVHTLVSSCMMLFKYVTVIIDQPETVRPQKLGLSLSNAIILKTVLMSLASAHWDVSHASASLSNILCLPLIGVYVFVPNSLSIECQHQQCHGHPHRRLYLTSVYIYADVDTHWHL